VSAGPLRFRPAGAAVVLLALAVLSPGHPARAHFERMLLSSRSASLGGAFVAIADDPSSVIDNPAGLCGIPTLSLLSTYQRPYGVEGLDEGYFAVAVPARFVSLGASWFHRGVSQALSEDLLTIAVGRDLKRTSEDASLSVGASVELARVSVADGFDTSGSEATFGFGVLLRPFAFIGVGYTMRNVNQPRFDLVAGGGDTPLSRAQAVGLSYYWQQRLVVTVESGQDAGGQWRTRGGFELRVENHLSLRGGLDGPEAAAGVGVTWRGLTFDAAMRGHESLGASYLVTLRYARPAGVKPY
jgi:hypothetical protein